WSTLSAQPASKCATQTEMSWDGSTEPNSRFWLFSPSLLKPVCVQLSTTDYAPGEFLPGSARLKRKPLILWVNNQSVDYTPDRVPLRVTVEDPGHLLVLDKHSCPQLFLRVRDATPSRGGFSRATRVDEVQGTNCTIKGTRYLMEFDASHILGQINKE